jgi:hypothetical protein
VVGKKRIIGLLVAAAVLAGAVLFVPAPGTDVQVSKGSAQVSQSKPADRFEALPAREGMGAPQGKPFGSQDWTPLPSAVSNVKAAPVAPTAPPMPYRVAGRVVHEGAAHVVLAVGDRVLTVRAGEKLDDGYVVESIDAEGVTLLYEPLGVRQQLPFVSALGLEAPLAKAALAPPPRAPPASQASQAAQADGEPRPARLRWDGPARVHAGDTFEVALRVTSERPVRASPLQLSFDAKLLEPVGVKPGDFFSGGSFSYRINPAGSIFVGALSPGAAAADAEFLVVTFRPIRAGTTAELRLSSFALHGIAGGTIAHDRPADFRAAIQ